MAIGHAQKHLPEECARTRLRQATVVDHLAEELTLQTTANRACSASGPGEKELHARMCGSQIQLCRLGAQLCTQFKEAKQRH